MGKLKSGIAIGLIVFTVLMILFSLGLFATWQERLTDTLYTRKQAPDDIVIIAIDDTSIQEIGRWPWDRQVHANLLNKLGEHPPKVIGYDVSFLEPSDEKNDQALAESIKKLSEKSKIVLAAENNEQMLTPIETLRDEAFWGVVNTFPDSDGIVRKAGGQDSFAGVIAGKTDAIRINFLGYPGTFETYSFSDVLNGKVKPETFAGKIVLIGATAPDLHDDQAVPTSAKMSGVEIQANVIQTLLDESAKSSETKILTILTILAISTITSVIFMFLSPALVAVFAVLFIFAYILFSIFSFDYGVIRNIIYPVLAIILSGIVSIIYKYLTESAAKKFIRKMFSYYLSETVLAHLLEHPEKIKLGGERREITVLFSDIAGFTSISESMEADKLAELLNNYLTRMTEVVFKNDGVLDKYIGDAVMAFWGAPVESKNHALAACKTALEMQDVITQNFDFTARIGINTGEMVVGNMGSTQRFDYSLLGDNVNLGSRLEGINKIYGTKICISETTYKQVKNKITARKLDTVAVKGKKTGVMIYELRHMNKPTKNEEIFLREFEKARSLYEKGEFKKSLQAFKLLATDYPADGPTRMYLERIPELIKSPPESWDGVYHATSK